MNSETKRLMIIAGGTGGHVFPGLAVAHYLIAQGWQVRWLGTADRMEADLVPQQGIEIDFIQISGLRGKGLWAQLLALIRIYRAICQAKNIMRDYQPHVILGMGGYVSGPGGLAARWCGVPLVVHEQNGIAGLTNRVLAKIAKKVLQAFPGALPHAEVVGNPIRMDVLRLPPPKERLAGRQGAIRVLVIGGSQGAQILNQILPEVAAHLGDKVTLWHQVGQGALTGVLQIYQQLGQDNQHKITEFIDDMTAAYAWADVVVCRSGALTVSEIAAVGLPAIFIPFQHKDRQQYWNAVPLEKVGAAKIIEQPRLTAQILSNLLASWDRATLMVMADKARTMASLDATERVAAAIITAGK
ncbi:undecaprenyldiphospho-muramoylpentapeptide beta-N-acetylglucosaminyltransferase [Candidatus Regiella insecticola]|uniref:UDP-N-acetylglucosamine--N-acetylmuramyl-(pentapeptide) pyrophosphoryl-undecaprenol N-acetylglucosamine transferase n=1 Tax=Candidatus Regiella insecticola TaxID=138073 RepID=A0A6L2ZT31_9ENTR|nr:undecaprenyldiphospho-muramoylpentapeptide beta-N-acetylglucosaminyltransferase [Candidatus Regiella insecticola]GFN47351.1 UDP-N-acetylglucosamine--N-acetylmuramyl-(pentapeptide) pyrophosphoryl-undecaprenol N-acetylglucosamine transferase [Candidatus Regiella insecticola]